MAHQDSPRQSLKGARVMVRALRHRNYRLFFVGQTVSLVGTWLSRTATAWLVYRLTDSAALLGVVGFASLIPTFVLSPLAGVLVDRWDRHRILVVAQILSMAQSLTMATLALTGVIAIWQIIALSLFQGCINAFDMPARQSFLVQMVEDREDLSNAIALNSSMFNGARLVGPSIAGVLIATVGEGMCFLLDGFSYLAVIFSLLVMKLPKSHSPVERTPVLRQLMDGFNFAFGFTPVRAILLLTALTGLMGMPYTVLMPVFARDVIGGDANTFGFMMATVGMGALTGALYLASRRTVLGLGRIIPLMAALYGLGLIAFSQSRSLTFSYPLLFTIGFGMMVQLASCNTILQTIVEDDKRGRVMSFYGTAFLGMTPFGSLMAGSMAGRIGAPATILINGMIILAGAALFAAYLPRIRELVRPIYVKRGIIPEVAVGIHLATIGTDMQRK